MKIALLLIVLTLATSLTAFTHKTTLTNQFGSLTISNADITSTGSQLRTVNGITPPPGQSLSSVSFSTGALTSGSVTAGGTFSSSGSTFDGTRSGKGVPHGAIFTGSFTGPVTWTLVSQGGHGHNLTYTFSGAISGMLHAGRIVSGTTTQTIYSTSGQLSEGIGHIGAGGTTFAVPEPNTLVLLGTGLVAMARLFRRKSSGLRTIL
jgi:PEP-CTERM motif